MGVVDLSKPSEYIVHLVLVPVLSLLMQREGVRILLCDRASLRKKKEVDYGHIDITPRDV